MATLWTPGFLGGVRLWFKDEGLTGYADNDPVPSWRDSSGNGLHAVNATGTEQPLCKTALVNGLPAIRTDGTDDDLTTPAPGNVKPSTLAFVMRLASATPPASARIFSQGTPLTVRMAATSYAMLGSTAVNYHTGLDTNWHVHVLTFATTSSSRGAFDGTAVTVDAGTSATGAVATIGSANVSSWLAMDMAELVLISNTVSAADLDRLDGYLAHRFGLTANLPGGHTYKTDPPLLGGRSSVAGIL